MKRIINVLSAIYLVSSLLSSPVPALASSLSASTLALDNLLAIPSLAIEKWNAGDEVSRLLYEAPTLAAFSGTSGVIWMSSHRYSLTPDGGKLHYGIFLLLLGDAADADVITSKKFPYPTDDGAVFEIDEASWYDAFTGQRLGELRQREYNENGIRGIEVIFPEETEGHVVAVTTTEMVPSNYQLDDVIFLAGELPVWEQTIEVAVPDGMRLYWEGSGVREPERKSDNRTQVTTWTLLNEPAWLSSGLIESWRPSLAFSLDYGQLPILKNLRELENPVYAPRAPSSISSTRSNLVRTAENIAIYMSSRLIPLENGTNVVRPMEVISEEGPWTAWEQVMIAGRWFSSLGFNANIYWEQNLRVGSDGPASLRIWKEPILIATDSDGREVFFKAGWSGDPEKPHPSLLGSFFYRAGNNGLERTTLPRGSASDHTLIQNWNVTVGENGVASGTLEITMTGGWMDVFGIERDGDAQSIGTSILSGKPFNMPGTNISVESARPLPNGCRVSFSVHAVPGIVSSDSILLKLMGGMPVSFEDIPLNGARFNMRFPFVFEINWSIKTPAGYRALSVPEKIQTGDSSATLEQSLTHWPRRALAEGRFRWTVRTSSVDEYMSGVISNQYRMLAGLLETSIPLRK